MSRFAIALRAGAAPLLATLMIVAGPIQADEPSTQVETLNATLLQAMQKADELGFDGRVELLSPVLTDSFNFPVMARIAVGRHWGALDEKQQDRLVDAFSRMSISTFASRFDDYGGEHFEILGERPAARGNITILNQIVQTSGKATSINYLLSEFDGDWRIVDIFLDGKFSELALARSEYASVIRRDGFDHLIDVLEEKIERLATRDS